MEERGHLEWDNTLQSGVCTVCGARLERTGQDGPIYDPGTTNSHRHSQPWGLRKN